MKSVEKFVGFFLQQRAGRVYWHFDLEQQAAEGIDGDQGGE